MTTNKNPDTGIAYGLISLASLDDCVVDSLLYGNQSVDLTTRQYLAEIDAATQREIEGALEEASIAAAETDSHMCEQDRESFEEKFMDGWYASQEATDEEDLKEQRRQSALDGWWPDEPLTTGTLEGVHYQTTWLGGAQHLWVFQSPHTATFQACSPCAPGAADLNSPSKSGIQGYDVPTEWRLK